MLLSDPDTAKLLNTEFVPCWDMVRPVPQVTIDFGNGKVLKRTLAGNTVISICTSDGKVLDAYPGVYTPAAFKAQIGDTLGLFRKLAEIPPAPAAERSTVLAAWHRERFLTGVRAEGQRTTLSKAFVESPLLEALSLRPSTAMVFGQPSPAPVAPSATEAGMLTATSATVLQSVASTGAQPPLPTVRAAAAPPPGADPLTDPKGAFGLFSARLEDASKRAATVRQLRAATSGRPLPEKTPEQIGKEAVETDSLVNVRTIRPAVHLWFMANGTAPEVGTVRDAMYRDLLHVPIDDPYLGLMDALVPGSNSSQHGK